MYHEGRHDTPEPARLTRPGDGSLNRLAFTATLHCLWGCAVGEVMGMAVGTALGWSALPTIALAVALAFLFGYAFTMVPLLRAGMAFGAVLKLALLADIARAGSRGGARSSRPLRRPVGRSGRNSRPVPSVGPASGTRIGRVK